MFLQIVGIYLPAHAELLLRTEDGYSMFLQNVYIHL
jgi:hypothetical protein